MRMTGAEQSRLYRKNHPGFEARSVYNRRKRNRQKFIDYAGGKCSRCGYNTCINSLDFHHLDPSTKSFSLCHRNMSKGLESIKAEVDKCILVCANCHREIHLSNTKNHTRLQYILLAGGKCSECGYDKEPEILEFHHIDPTSKSFDFSQRKASKYQAAINRILEEIKKCVLLCPNCHRKHLSD